MKTWELLKLIDENNISIGAYEILNGEWFIAD